MSDGESNEINNLNFDFKAFVFRVISYWKWILLVLIIGFNIQITVKILA